MAYQATLIASFSLPTVSSQFGDSGSQMNPTNACHSAVPCSAEPCPHSVRRRARRHVDLDTRTVSQDQTKAEAATTSKIGYRNERNTQPRSRAAYSIELCQCVPMCVPSLHVNK